MGATSKTPFMGLPQFVEGDKPSWLTDVNDAMLKIDTCSENMKTRVSEIDSAVDDKSLYFKVYPDLFYSQGGYCSANATASLCGSILSLSVQFMLENSPSSGLWIISLNGLNGNPINLEPGTPGLKWAGDGETKQQILISSRSTNLNLFATMRAGYNSSLDKTVFDMYISQKFSSLNAPYYGSGTFYFKRRSDLNGCQ